MRQKIFAESAFNELAQACFRVCNFACLFAKFPQPWDSEMTFAVFESSCSLLLPV